jgi:hypothetical protein
MTHTFLHSGVLIGESDLEHRSRNPRQFGGVFRPTSYGLEIFPRLSGVLSAGAALKAYLDSRGLSLDTMAPDAVEEVLGNTREGQRMIEIGRTLSEVEMRAPNGRRLEIASIAFSDLSEVQRLARELKVRDTFNATKLPPDAPRYIVSATLHGDTRAFRTPAHVGRRRR